MIDNLIEAMENDAELKKNTAHYRMNNLVRDLVHDAKYAVCGGDLHELTGEDVWFNATDDDRKLLIKHYADQAEYDTRDNELAAYFALLTTIIDREIIDMKAAEIDNAVDQKVDDYFQRQLDER